MSSNEIVQVIQPIFESAATYGGLVWTAFSDYWSRVRIQRMQDLVNRYAAEVKRAPDVETVCPLIERALIASATAQQEFKRALLARILIDATNRDDADMSMAGLFLDITNAMEPYHATVLRVLASRRRYSGSIGEMAERIQIEGLGVKENPDDWQVKLCVARQAVTFLDGQGLLRSERRNTGELRIQSESPMEMWSKSHFSLSSLGERYCEHLVAAMKETGEGDDE